MKLWSFSFSFCFQFEKWLFKSIFQILFRHLLKTLFVALNGLAHSQYFRPCTTLGRLRVTYCCCLLPGWCAEIEKQNRLPSMTLGIEAFSLWSGRCATLQDIIDPDLNCQSLLVAHKLWSKTSILFIQQSHSSLMHTVTDIRIDSLLQLGRVGGTDFSVLNLVVTRGRQIKIFPLKIYPYVFIYKVSPFRKQFSNHFFFFASLQTQ